MSRVVPCCTVVCLLLAFVACGGSGSGGGGGGTNPPPPPPPTPTNPCQSATALAADDTFEPPQTPSNPPPKRNIIDGDTRWRVLDALWLHRQAQLTREQQPQTALEAPAVPRRNVDIGEIAVVQDEGDLVAPANQYDLRNLGLRFARNGAGGYDITRIDGTFRQTLGTRQTLTDDDSAEVPVPFGFSFYGRTQTAAFVNSDGNITFEQEDKASSERNVARLLTGPPRVSLFLADLDPTTGTGRIFVHAASDQYTVTWCNVRQFESTLTVTAQATLLPDGTIEFKFENPTIGDAIVALSPGRTGIFTAVDLSASGPIGGGSAAVGERFATSPELDIAALTKKFYRDHPDNYDQLVIWTDLRYVSQGVFAYETTIANEVRGIGVPVFDLSRDFGSGGRLRSLAVMDQVAKYPENPATRFLGENNTLSVLGQEVGHRWMAFINFRDHTGQRSDALLGRGQSHWSFFLDSDASVMEGNDIEDRGGGSFRTVAAVQRYSLLDQYLMGLIPESEVPPFFYVQNPVPSRDPGEPPQVGHSFTGTRRDVLIQHVVEIHGPRLPSAAESAKVHRQAFIYMVTAGRSTESAQVDKVDRIRREWEAFFSQATSGRMTAQTRLR